MNVTVYAGLHSVKLKQTDLPTRAASIPLNVGYLRYKETYQRGRAFGESLLTELPEGFHKPRVPRS